MEKNIQITSEIARYIKSRMKDTDFGLEVEVGEIGRKDDHGLVLTKPEEAVAFIKALNENDVYPQVLAIANGSVHGHTYDESGNVIEQLFDRHPPDQGGRTCPPGEQPACGYRPARHYGHAEGSDQSAFPEGGYHQGKCGNLLAGYRFRHSEGV